MQPALPVHPLVVYRDSLPTIPGMRRTSWGGYTKPQTLKFFKDWDVSEPLPKKGAAVSISIPGGALARVTKPNGPLYLVEQFSR